MERLITSKVNAPIWQSCRVYKVLSSYSTGQDIKLRRRSLLTTTAPPIKLVVILSSPKSTTTSLAKLAGVYRPRLLNMADIIGIIAFVGHIVHKIVDIVKEIQDAPEDITALRDDAAEIGYLLRQLQQSNALHTVILPSDGRVQLEALAERMQNALREIRSFIAKISKERHGKLRVRKLKWFLTSARGRCEKLRGSLTSLKASIMAIMTASTSYVAG